MPSPGYQRIDVASVTPRTAPPYVRLTYTQRNSSFVLPDGNDGEKLLVGPLGVNYFIERSDAEGIYLRRFDRPKLDHDQVTVPD